MLGNKWLVGGNWIGQNLPQQLRKISTHNQRSVQTHMNIDDMISVSFGRRRGVKDWLQRVCYALGAWLAQEDALEVVGLPPLRRRGEDFWKVLRCSRNDYWSSLWNSHHHSSTRMMSSARVSFRLVPAKVDDDWRNSWKFYIILTWVRSPPWVQQ